MTRTIRRIAINYETFVDLEFVSVSDMSLLSVRHAKAIVGLLLSETISDVCFYVAMGQEAYVVDEGRTAAKVIDYLTGSDNG